MNRLKLFILIFLVTISLPLTFVIYQSYSGLKQEERSQLSFFCATLIDQIEEDLARLVQAEETRSVDEYQHFLADSTGPGQSPAQLSPLADPAYQAYILGYLQNNPDGSMQTPLVPDLTDVPGSRKEVVTRLIKANEIFNSKKLSISPQPGRQKSPEPEPDIRAKGKAVFAERYLRKVTPERKSVYLGKKTQRLEEITAEQVRNIAPRTQDKEYGQAPVASLSGQPAVPGAESDGADSVGQPLPRSPGSSGVQFAAVAPSVKKFQVEVASFQSVALQDDDVYIFRRIVIDNQIYRQGFVLLVEPLLQHLIDTRFAGQPLADFATLSFQGRDQGEKREILKSGNGSTENAFVMHRLFPAPFDFLSVSLTAHAFPPSPARRTLNVALGVLGIFMFLGLVAIYQSVRSIVNLSERRAQFVSSVTHELKTPLTNIRMYIEMLDQGVAGSPEREREYLAILDSESSRLSGLINNVLELARLEKKQRNFNFSVGRLDDVFSEVEAIMAHKVKNEGFKLEFSKADIAPFSYDRDVLIQILVNLIENSLKFGKNEPKREITVRADSVGKTIRLGVSDTGPGIPRHALEKVFTDFYRADNVLALNAGGTGIGLALVRKFAVALGGSVKATNNKGPGCTITLVLPA